jgi:hypothetical protein
MVPSLFIQQQIAALLAADVASLAATTAPKVHLSKAPFTPSPSLDPTSMVESDFAGYASVPIVSGTQLVFQDPLTLLQTIELKEPAGGFHFAVSGTAGLPQTVYGYYVLDSAGAVLLGSARLDTPIPLTANGQAFDIEGPGFAFLNNSPQ